MPRLSTELTNLIAILRALNLAYHHAHVNASGPTFAGDHQLLQRLYFGEDNNGAPILEIDSVMERLRGLDQDAQLDPTMIAEMSARILEDHFGEGANWQALLDLEVMLQAAIAELGEDLETGKTKVARRYLDGLVNLLQGIADRHQTNVYLIQQRLRAAATTGHRRRNVRGCAPCRRRRRIRDPRLHAPTIDNSLWMPSWFRGWEL